MSLRLALGCRLGAWLDRRPAPELDRRLGAWLDRRPALVLDCRLAVGLAALSLAAAVLFGGCGPAGAGPTASPVPAVTPGTQLTEPTAEIAAARATLEERLAETGFDLVQSTVPYRPGEPGDVQLAPRAVYRVVLADPNAGWVLLYDLSSPDAAAQAARSFADYLRSGVGQTNYPRDAQFALNQLGGVLLFSWWSRERAADPERAEAAFEVIRGVGTPTEVIR